jgi:hypothetical protein
MTDDGWRPPSRPVKSVSKFPPGPARRCAAVSATTGKQCRNQCAPGSDLCATHRAHESRKK